MPTTVVATETVQLEANIGSRADVSLAIQLMHHQLRKATIMGIMMIMTIMVGG